MLAGGHGDRTLFQGSSPFPTSQHHGRHNHCIACSVQRMSSGVPWRGMQDRPQLFRSLGLPKASLWQSQRPKQLRIIPACHVRCDSFQMNCGSQPQIILEPQQMAVALTQAPDSCVQCQEQRSRATYDVNVGCTLQCWCSSFS